MNFDHFMPTRIVFGRGRVRELAALAPAFGRRALVVTGRRSTRESGALDAVQAALASGGVEASVFDGVSANPRSDEVDAAVALARRDRCDFVVGLGGGSAIDAAKAAAASFGRDSVRELIGTTLPGAAPALPIVAIPTTAGTGSEVTRGAIVKDVVRNFKSGIRGDCIFPRLAIVDPDLSRGMPRGIALATAFDALTHAIESFVARAATPLTDALAEKALRLFAAHMHPGAPGAADPRAHDAMCLMALLGGINVGNVGSCLPHRLQQALASVEAVEASHAEGLAAVYPSWLRRAYPFAADKFDTVGALLGFASRDLPAEMAALIAGLGLSPNLARWDYLASDAATVVGSASGNFGNDPIDGAGPELAGAVFLEALSGAAAHQSHPSGEARR